MYAIVKIGGMQWKAEEAKVLRVPKLDVEPGKSVNLDQVLLFVDQGKVQVGKPVVDGVTVQIKVLSHGKDKKVNVFKKKRRKGYNVLRGHRQEFTEVKVEKIGVVKAVPTKPKETESAKAKATTKTSAAKAAKVPKTAAKTAKPKAAESAAKPKTAKPRAATKTAEAKETKE